MKRAKRGTHRRPGAGRLAEVMVGLVLVAVGAGIAWPIIHFLVRADDWMGEPQSAVVIGPVFIPMSEDSFLLLPILAGAVLAIALVGTGLTGLYEILRDSIDDLRMSYVRWRMHRR